jgi:hypothetical protein
VQKLPQLTLRDLFWVVALVAVPALADEPGAPDLPNDAQVVSMREFYKEFRNPKKGFGGVTTYRFLGRKDGFDYFDFVEDDEVKRVFKIKSGQLSLGERSEVPRRVAVIIFPKKWREAFHKSP